MDAEHWRVRPRQVRRAVHEGTEVDQTARQRIVDRLVLQVFCEARRHVEDLVREVRRARGRDGLPGELALLQVALHRREMADRLLRGHGLDQRAPSDQPHKALALVHNRPSVVLELEREVCLISGAEAVEAHDALLLVLQQLPHARVHLLERRVVGEQREGREVDQPVIDAVVALVAAPDGDHHADGARQNVDGVARQLHHQDDDEEAQAHRAGEHRAGAHQRIVGGVDGPRALAKALHARLLLEPAEQRQKVRREPRRVLLLADRLADREHEQANDATHASTAEQQRHHDAGGDRRA